MRFDPDLDLFYLPTLLYRKKGIKFITYRKNYITLQKIYSIRWTNMDLLSSLRCYQCINKWNIFVTSMRKSFILIKSLEHGEKLNRTQEDYVDR